MRRASTLIVMISAGMLLTACEPVQIETVGGVPPAVPAPAAPPAGKPNPAPPLSPGNPDPTASDSGKPGGAEDKPGGAEDKPGGSGDKPGGSEDKPGGSGDKPGGAGDGPRAGTEGLGPVGAPRVFTAMHGSNALAAPGNEDQWSFVRANLDGLWANSARFSTAEQVALWNKIATRNMLGVRALRDEVRNVGTWGRAEDIDHSLALNQEAVALYTPTPGEWNGKTVSQAQEHYVSGPGVTDNNRFGEIWTGWSIHNFTEGRGTKPITGDAQKAFSDAAGMFVECGSDRCADGYSPAFLNAINAAHSQGKHFMWFANTATDAEGKTGALERFQATYNFLRDKGLWHTNDVVMLINYGGAYPVLPETVNGQPADTITGMLYWALKQEGVAPQAS